MKVKPKLILIISTCKLKLGFYLISQEREVKMSDVVLRDKDFEYSSAEDLAKISPLSTAAGQSTCNQVL